MEVKAAIIFLQSFCCKYKKINTNWHKKPPVIYISAMMPHSNFSFGLILLLWDRFRNIKMLKAYLTSGSTSRWSKQTVSTLVIH